MIVCCEHNFSSFVFEDLRRKWALVSQSVLSSVEALAELSLILSWAEPASRGLKGEGWVGPSHSFITISNKWESLHQAPSPFCSVSEKFILWETSNLLFTWGFYYPCFFFPLSLVTDTWEDLNPFPIPWPLPSPIDVNSEAFCSTIKSISLPSS